MKIVLFQPQIPQNTGNIVRTCSVTGNELILVTPLGFSVNDRWLKRAGLDYWEGVNVQIVDDLESLLQNTSDNFYFLSSKASTCYSEHTYGKNDWLIFGSETSGLPSEWSQRWPERYARIPMQPEARCLNLATSVGIVVYEAWRQQGFES
jgi:tRNA (cytidine/uridine-2'-O-)-methyltransferase